MAADPHLQAEAGAARWMGEILDRVGDGFVAFDFGWRLVYANQAAADHYAFGREDALGKVAWEYPIFQEHMRGFLEEAMAARADRDAEAPSVRFPGLWFHLRAFPLSGGLGVSFRDITAQRELLRREREQSERLELALATSGFGDWRWDMATDLTHLSPRAAEIVGLPAGAVMTWTQMLEHIHADDREPARLAVIRAMTDGASYEIEYRIKRPSDGAERWIMVRARPQMGDDGRPAGMLGVLTDITDAKTVAARERLLINELNHRVKNTLATIQSLARQTVREGVPAADARERLTERLLALSAAHNVLTNENWEGADVGEIARQAVRPYDDPQGRRIAVTGPRARLAPNVALAVSMALHELATNAVKYGALSAPGGRVALDWSLSQPGAIAMTWRESGGPPVAAPKATGFGSRLLAGLSGELGAPAVIAYEPGGLVCRLRAPAASGL